MNDQVSANTKRMIEIHAGELQGVLLHFWLVLYEIGDRIMRCGTSAMHSMGDAIKRGKPVLQRFSKLRGI